jgi:catechol 2,3-dioxygenase-like lactoylglutathione lyase family enzyme
MAVISTKSLSHIGLKSQDVERQAAFYAQMVGLGETERDSVGRVYLRCNANHHSVVLIPSSESGIDHVALDVGGPAELDAAANALSKAGISYETVRSGEPGQAVSLRLRDPNGYVIELISTMTQVNPNYGPRAVQPRKLGHVTLQVADCKQAVDFYREVLGFRVSDWVDDIFVWMRCNPDHHSFAFARADTIKMHHVAFEIKDLSYLARQADHLMQNGYVLLYGPGRHGPGQNHFSYFRDPEGNLIEFACDLQQIWDDVNYVPKVWNSQERWVNMWGPEAPVEFME